MNVTAQVKNGILEVRTDDLVLKYSVDSTASVARVPIRYNVRSTLTGPAAVTG